MARELEHQMELGLDQLEQLEQLDQHLLLEAHINANNHDRNDGDDHDITSDAVNNDDDDVQPQTGLGAPLEHSF